MKPEGPRPKKGGEIHMTNLKTKLATGILTAGILASSFVPAAFAANVKIKGTGAMSVNHAHVKTKKVTEVSQYNGTAVVNLVGVGQNTGGNSSSFNTGKKSATTVSSGRAVANVTNSTETGSNNADVNGCCCGGEENTDVVIKNTGALSHNHVSVSDKCITKAEQSNETLVVNGVLVGQNTGLNSASFNTGGTTSVDSGNASANVTNTTTTGSNNLVVN